MIFLLSATNFRALDNVILNGNISKLTPDLLIAYSESSVESNFMRVYAENLKLLNGHEYNIGNLRQRAYFAADNTRELPLVFAQPDIVCCFNTNVFAIGEIKPFWSLTNMPDSPQEIRRLYALRPEFPPDEQSDFELNHRVWLRCLAQAYGYMIENKVKFGFLSGFNRSWFIRADAENSISISQSYSCDSGNTFRAFAFFLHLAKSEWTNGLRCPTTVNLRTLSFASSDPDDSINSSSSLIPSNHSSYGTRSRMRSLPTSSPSSGGVLGTQTSLASQVCSMGDCEDVHRLGEGRLGMVIGCTFRDVALAIKYVDIVKGNVAALEKEIALYRKLEEFQGELIPRVIYYHSESVMMTGFAMQRLDPLPNDWLEWNSSLRSQAFNCVLQLAQKAGVIHNDLRPCNFGLLNGQKVLVFDLEDVSFCGKGDKAQLTAFERRINGLLLF
mmetsp:Transcript_27122/g.37261  ORF Transcript_27122/g.37261 Transcript_27122/m.37261 type:complete len:443 (-) Transcript_27122:106-1434(-)